MSVFCCNIYGLEGEVRIMNTQIQIYLGNHLKMLTITAMNILYGPELAYDTERTVLQRILTEHVREQF